MFDERVAVEQLKSWLKKRLKKFLTNRRQHVKMAKLSQDRQP